MRIADIVNRTGIYGPGWRTAVWVQGCSLACKGCWNMELWPTKGGEDMDHDTLLERLMAAETEGVTFLGGEPLQQAEALLPLLQDLRMVGKSIFLYSGYTREEMDETQRACLDLADIAVLGRYVEEERDTTLRWRGSRNQEVEFLTGRYGPEDMDGEATEVEYHVGRDGMIRVVGYPDLVHLAGLFDPTDGEHGVG